MTSSQPVSSHRSARSARPVRTRSVRTCSTRARSLQASVLSVRSETERAKRATCLHAKRASVALPCALLQAARRAERAARRIWSARSARPVCVALVTQTCSARARAFQTRAPCERAKRQRDQPEPRRAEGSPVKARAGGRVQRQPTISNQPPAASHQQPATSHQQPATSHQPPAISNQPSAGSVQARADQGPSLPSASFIPRPEGPAERNTSDPRLKCPCFELLFQPLCQPDPAQRLRRWAGSGWQSG